MLSVEEEREANRLIYLNILRFEDPAEHKRQLRAHEQAEQQAEQQARLQVQLQARQVVVEQRPQEDRVPEGIAPRPPNGEGGGDKPSTPHAHGFAQVGQVQDSSQAQQILAQRLLPLGLPQQGSSAVAEPIPSYAHSREVLGWFHQVGVWGPIAPTAVQQQYYLPPQGVVVPDSPGASAQSEESQVGPTAIGTARGFEEMLIDQAQHLPQLENGSIKEQAAKITEATKAAFDRHSVVHLPAISQWGTLINTAKESMTFVERVLSGSISADRLATLTGLDLLAEARGPRAGSDPDV